MPINIGFIHLTIKAQKLNMSDFTSPTTNAPPFIIWTLQRTGGTNLTQRLVELSGLNCTQHEPFNVGRIYGHITQQWIESNDESALAKEMQAVAEQHVIIKHCLETVPWEVSSALIDAAIRSGYKHLFLYRKNALDRLLSLNFAEKTGVWGPNMRSETTLNEPVDLSIPVDKLIAHERKCIKLMQRAWQYLISQGEQPLSLSYEELYRVTPEEADQTLLPILNVLGLSKTEQQDHDFVREIIGKGDQGTRDKYESMVGVEKLKQALSEVSCFAPVTGVVLHIESLALPNWILMARIDTLPDTLLPGQFFNLSGIVVLNENAPKELSLHLTHHQTEMNIDWGKPSPKIAKCYPDNVQSAHARFKSDKIHAINGDAFVIAIKTAAGAYHPLFNILPA